MKSFKYTVRRFIPPSLLALYRPLRFLSRVALFRFSNKKQAKHFQNLILARFPTLSESTNSGVVLDIGANVGHFSAACRNLGYTVVAVEPHPIALLSLRKRFREDSQIIILNKAVTNDFTKVHLHMHPQHSLDPKATSIAASIYSDKFTEETFHVEVESTNLHQLVERYGPFEIVKVDIEGAEMLLVDDIISNHKDIGKLLMETHERFMENTSESSKYRSKLQDLNNFIRTKKLEVCWLTDWI
jgi:FkbM family methyltransferase